jgi:predicted pyridoxine 5'-phosphate oxidase superfamily flavin-nucleotide-binding protein
VHSEKTLSNVNENPLAAVAVLDVLNRKGFQLKGRVEKVSEGEIYDKVIEQLNEEVASRSCSPVCSCDQDK